MTLSNAKHSSTAEGARITHTGSTSEAHKAGQLLFLQQE